MKTAGLSLVAISAALLSLALFSTGCPGNMGTDGGMTDSGGNPTDSGNNGMDSGNPGMDSGSPDSGTPDSGTTCTVTANDAGLGACDDYCGAIMTNCTGTLQQYSSYQSCIGFCQSWPAGMAGDTSGASIACHDYHAHAADAGATLHCPHAGPSGAGICGTLCENFCFGEATVCTCSPYASAGDCMAACGAFDAGVGSYNDSFFGGDTDFCRLYHLTAAAVGPTAMGVHCPHTAPVSAVCHN